MDGVISGSLELCLVHHSDSLFRLLYLLEQNKSLASAFTRFLVENCFKNATEFLKRLFKLVLSDCERHVPNKYLAVLPELSRKLLSLLDLKLWGGPTVVTRSGTGALSPIITRALVVGKTSSIVVVMAASDMVVISIAIVPVGIVPVTIIPVAIIPVAIISTCIIPVGIISVAVISVAIIPIAIVPTVMPLSIIPPIVVIVATPAAPIGRKIWCSLIKFHKHFSTIEHLLVHVRHSILCILRIPVFNNSKKLRLVILLECVLTPYRVIYPLCSRKYQPLSRHQTTS